MRWIVLVMLVAVGVTPWLRLNVSGSAPLGLYRLTAVPTIPERGMLVVLPVPASVRAWHSAWQPLLKPVAGVAGDTVCQANQRLAVNDVDYGPVYQAAQGRTLPHMDAGCQPVPEGQVFLASAAPKSLDSRYFRAVRVHDLTARALPLLTWR